MEYFHLILFLAIRWLTNHSATGHWTFSCHRHALQTHTLMIDELQLNELNEVLVLQQLLLE